MQTEASSETQTIRAASTILQAGTVVAAVGGAIVLGNLARSLFNLWPITEQPQRYLGTEGLFHVSLGWYLTGAVMILAGAMAAVAGAVAKAIASAKPSDGFSSAVTSLRPAAMVFAGALCLLPAIPVTMELNARREALQSKADAEAQQKRSAEILAKAKIDQEGRTAEMRATQERFQAEMKAKSQQQETQELAMIRSDITNLTSTDAKDRYLAAQELIRHTELRSAPRGTPFGDLRTQIIETIDNNTTSICSSAQIAGMIDVLYSDLNPEGAHLLHDKVETARRSELQKSIRSSPMGLHNAVAEQNIPAIHEYLKNVPHESINADPAIIQAMRLATRSGQKGVVDALLGSGVSPDIAIANGQTALYEICSEPGSTTMLALAKDLLDKGASPNITTPFGTCLLSAIQRKNDDLIKLLLDSKADPNAKGQNDDTPLSEAFGHQNIPLATLLLQHGADPNVEFRTRTLPILQAVEADDSALVALLLDKGAKVDKPGPNGQTAIFTAVQKHHTELVTMLLKHGANPDLRVNNEPLVVAVVRQADVDMLKAFVEAKAKLDGRNLVGEGLVQIAVEDNDPKILKVLVDGGAPLDGQDTFGQTPLLTAIERRQDDSAGVLIDGKADVNKRDQFGRSALAQAAEFDDVPLVQKLLDAKADPNITDQFGRTLLDRLGGADEKLLKVLKDHGAKKSPPPAPAPKQLAPGSTM